MFCVLTFLIALWSFVQAKNLYIKTECVITGTTGGLMDPNYSYKIS